MMNGCIYCGQPDPDAKARGTDGSINYYHIACNAKRVEALVNAFNAKHPIGTPVIRYKLIRPLCEPQNTQTRSKAWVMNGIPMVMVEGVTGGVSLESVEPI